MDFLVISLAYAAGFFDGEGTVSVPKRKVKEKYYYRLNVSVSNTYRKTLEEFQVAFGGQIYNDTNYVNKPLFSWQINGQEAAKFLQQIEPFLAEKRSQAWLGMEYSALTVARDTSEYQQALREGFHLALQLEKRNGF